MGLVPTPHTSDLLLIVLAPDLNRR
jgi:hypothetical protein